MQIIEKEINKKEEFCKLVLLYQKAKNVKINISI